MAKDKPQEPVFAGIQFDRQIIKLSLIATNRGQIEGLPRNPRLIRDERFAKLKQSIKDLPDMLKMRPMIVFPLSNGHFVAIAGNMRLVAAKDLGYKEIEALVLDPATPIERIAEIAIKDNVSFGEDDFDVLANEWTGFDLTAFGLQLPGPGDDGYHPTVDPNIVVSKVSAEDIVKTREELDEKFTQNAEPHREIICPHCYKEFWVSANI